MPGQNDGIQTPESAADAYTEFSDIFASLTDKGDTGSEENTSTDQAAGATGAEGNAEQQTQPTDGTGDSGEPAQAGADTAVTDGAGSQDDQGGEPAGGNQGAQNVDWQAQFEALQSQFDAFKAGTQQAAAPQPQPAAQSQPPAVYTPEETTELAELQKDWPDLHRMFTLMARQLQVDTLNYAFSEVGKVIQPLQESVSTYSTNDHMAAIYDAHADYDQVYQPVMEWIEQQPSFLKAAYQNVVKQGTAADVSTMIQRFKDETKWAAPAASGGSRATQQQAASAPSQQQTGLSEAAKKAAKAMGAVGTKRSAAATAQDPNDFDGAWNEAVGS